MSYFDPEIFCKENLKSADLEKLEYWNNLFTTMIDNTFDEYVGNDEDCDALRDLKKSIVEHFCKELKINLGYEMQDHVVAYIDSYDFEQDVKRREEYTTFLYDEEDS